MQTNAFLPLSFSSYHLEGQVVGFFTLWLTEARLTVYEYLEAAIKKLKIFLPVLEEIDAKIKCH